MYPKLLTLYGPFEINSYNLAYIIGISLFIYLANKHPIRARYLSTTAFINLVVESALAGIIGGRLLHILSSLNQYPTLLSWVSIWDGGLSVLGGLFGVLAYTIWYCRTSAIPLLALTDIGALYAPLLHAIGRIGCFLVGCCYGSPTGSTLSVTYTHPQVCAPLGVALHPAQLYSAGIYLILFILLLQFQHRMAAGTVVLWYLLGASIERFLMEFVRGDTIVVPNSFLTFYQLIALLLGTGALLGLILQRRIVHESV